MTLVLPFHTGDVMAAKRLMSWIADLGGCRGHQCILCADADTPYEHALDVKTQAALSFDSVKFITNGTSVRGWIPGSNSLFFTAAHRLQGRPFFFLEPDAVPLRSGWLDRIQVEYEKCCKPFMGALIKHDVPTWANPYMEGVAVYPHDTYSRLSQLLNPDVSWTTTTADAVVPNCKNTDLIHHIWGEVDHAPSFSKFPDPSNGVFGLDAIRSSAVVFHRCKDGTLINLLREARGIPVVEEKVVTFSHGGDVGDLIYGLCAIKAYGGGNLAITRHAVREAFSAEKAASLLPLLRIQPYIEYAEYHETDITPFGSNARPKFVDICLDKFREVQFSRRHNGLFENISETHLRLLGKPLEFAKEAWLTVDEPVQVKGKNVVFHRSDRYHNDAFPWKRIYERFKHQAVFVGYASEHRKFQGSVGQIPHHRTSNLLELARVIAGADLFVGNQSAPFAIAAGLGQNSILECCTWCPDCVFDRPNIITGKDASFAIPDVKPRLN